MSLHQVIARLTQLTALAATATALLLGTALAQTPGRSITIIVPYSPGTGIDILARAIGAELAQRWGQAVVIENKSGASGNIGTQAAARAMPDGHTLLLVAKPFVTNAGLFKNLPYDPVASFRPIIKIGRGFIVFVVHPSIPAETVPAFIAYAKARPGKINYGSPGFGTPHHLAMELFKLATGTNLVHVPYRGTSGVMSDLLGNHVSTMFVPFHVALPLAREHQIRILAVAHHERIAAAPELPTFAEQGMPDFEVDSWYGLFAPAGTPDDVVARYNQAVNDILREPQIVDVLAKQGLITAGGTPEALEELVRTDLVKWQKIMQDAGIAAE
jgi:tripartite-type tricarboxylate transporter receptor subunit TctC